MRRFAHACQTSRPPSRRCWWPRRRSPFRALRRCRTGASWSFPVVQIRSSALCYALLVGACAPQASEFPTTGAFARAERRPDGVASDPASAPVHASGGRETASGLVVLPAVPRDSAFAAVEQLGAAIAAENVDALATLLTPDAMWSNPSLGRSPIPAFGHFRERFRKLDYGRWASASLFVASEAEVLTYDDFDALPARGPRPIEMRPGDVLVRGRVVSPRAGYDRLFGDEMAVVVRPFGDRYRIALIVEDFPLA